jgi:macrolide transport system ATP-binding/permease protein
VTMLLVTHDPRVARHATRIVEMHDGRVIADRPVTDRLDAVQELAAMPAPEPEVSEEATEAQEP